MRSPLPNFLVSKPLLLVALALFLSTCGQKDIPAELVGTWVNEQHPITVRTEPSPMKFEFFNGTASTQLTIHADHSVTGNIGNAQIKNGQITTNWFLPVGMTGVAFTIVCELEGPIFEGDPLIKKEIQFWAGPFDGPIDTEIRYTSAGAQFPMGHIQLSRFSGD